MARRQVPSCEHGKAGQPVDITPEFRGLCCGCLEGYTREHGIFFDRLVPEQVPGTRQAEREAG